MTNPSPWLETLGLAPQLLVVGRYRVSAVEREAFLGDARMAVAVLAEQDGFVSGDIGQSMDDATLLTVTTRWRDAGAYRRALSAFDVKTSAVPLLSRAIDEPTAYELSHQRTTSGSTEATSGLNVDGSPGGGIGARIVGGGR